jgi:hypothetical protein
LVDIVEIGDEQIAMTYKEASYLEKIPQGQTTI